MGQNTYGKKSTFSFFAKFWGGGTCPQCPPVPTSLFFRTKNPRFHLTTATPVLHVEKKWTVAITVEQGLVSSLIATHAQSIRANSKILRRTEMEFSFFPSSTEKNVTCLWFMFWRRKWTENWGSEPQCFLTFSSLSWVPNRCGCWEDWTFPRSQHSENLLK